MSQKANKKIEPPESIALQLIRAACSVLMKSGRAKMSQKHPVKFRINRLIYACNAISGESNWASTEKLVPALLYGHRLDFVRISSEHTIRTT